MVLIRRTRPGQDSYLTTPGGGRLAGETPEEAAARECAEELGAEITVGPVAFVAYGPEPDSWVQHFYLARLDAIDPARRTGHEFSEPERGQYETINVGHDDAKTLALLQPPELRWILATHGRQLADEAAALA